MSAFPPQLNHPFTVSRYQRDGSRVDIAPRVRFIGVETINQSNVWLSHTDSGKLLDHKCTVHEGCVGHLLTHDGKTTLLPRWCISDDPEMMDRRAKATLNVMSGVITSGVYAREIRSTLMGKMGLARNRLLSSQPLTSMRGVAICLWDTSPHVVKVPSSWMDRMKVPHRISSDQELSPYWSFRAARNGDAAVLIRDPIVSDSSVQPVTVEGWEQHGIGVHPEMCVPLNMDYDGDEVHVLVLSWPESVSEIVRSIEASGLSKFPRPSPADARDFMACSTVSLSQLHSVDYNDEPARISRCKESSRRSMCESLDTNLALDYVSYVSPWSSSVSSMAASHLSVSLGYVLSRQLRICAMTLDPSQRDFRPMWSLAKSVKTDFMPGISLGAGETYGLPGARLALRLSGLVTQRYLDMAKERGGSSDDILLLSLISGHTTKCHIVSTPFGPRLVTGPLHDIPVSSVIASTDPVVNRGLGDSLAAYKSCVTMVQLACFRTSCDASLSEVAGLAALVCWSHIVVGHSRISDVFPVPFLSLVGCDVMTSSLCENIGVMDSVGFSPPATASCGHQVGGLTQRRVLPEASDISYASPYCALAMGNMTSLMRLSLSSRM